MQIVITMCDSYWQACEKNDHFVMGGGALTTTTSTNSLSCWPLLVDLQI